MKFALALLVLLPLALSASVDERYAEPVPGGYDIVDLAKQVLSQYATEEIEQQCEAVICPQLVDQIDGDNPMFTSLLCAAVCKEAQILAGTLLTTPGLEK